MDDRIVNVNWNDATNNKYLATIMIYAKPYDKAMLEIMQKATSYDMIIDTIKTINKTDDVLYELDLWVKNSAQLNNFIRDLNNAHYINEVMRFMK